MAGAKASALASSPADQAANEWRRKWLSALSRFHTLRSPAPLEGVWSEAGKDEWRWRVMIDNSPDEDTLRLVAAASTIVCEVPGLDDAFERRAKEIARLREGA